MTCDGQHGASQAPRAPRGANGEGGIYLLRSRPSADPTKPPKPDVWMVSFTDTDGKRKTRKSPKQTKAGARAHLRTLLKQRDNGESSDRSPTLKAFLPVWLEAKRIGGCRPRTLEAYEERIRLHILPHLGTTRLDRITADAITRVYGRLIDRGMSPTTANVIHHALGNLLAVARRRRLVPHVVTSLVEPPSRSHYEARTLTPDEARHLLASIADHRHGPLWTFMLGTGCRFGEAAGLTWANVNLDDGTAEIRQQISRERQKDQKIRYVVAPVKTDAGRRIVHLAPWVVAALLRQSSIIIPALRESSSAVATWRTCDFVFPALNGGPLQENHVLIQWHNALKAAGLEGQPGQRPLRQHDLRHTLGTLLADAGEDLVTIQRTLGHAKASITADLYIGRIPNALRAASDRYGALIVPTDDTES